MESMPTALVICRLAHFVATMLLFGAAAFVWALAPRELARELNRPARRMAAAAIIVAAVTALAWLALEAGQMGDGWGDTVNLDTLRAVAFETAFGEVWLWRIGLALVLVGALCVGRHDRWAFVVPVSAMLLASLGLVGHAAMQNAAPGALHRLNHAIHLLCAGAWLGALPPLVLCLKRCGDPHLRSAVGIALRRFSGLGHVIVALVVLTGIVNTMLTLGRWPADFASLYQMLLAAKILLVAAMIGLALVNRYVLTPRVKRQNRGALRALAVTSIVEIGLGAAVLALVSVFGTLAPI
jgi:putative copper resistance protein D